MDQSADIRRGESVWQAPPIKLLQPRQVLLWLLGLPERLGVAILVVALFSLTVLAIAAFYGAPLTVPRERTSIALGFHAILPVAVAVGLYSLLRLCRTLVGKRARRQAPMLRLVAIDLTLMGLFLLAMYFHFSLKTWVQLINPVFYDDHYYAVDRSLQPLIDLMYWLRTVLAEGIPTVDSWYQVAFLLMFILGFCTFSVSRSPVYPRFCIGVLLTLSLGAFSYFIAPALGPFIYEDGLNIKATEAQARMLWAHEQVMREGMPWVAEAGDGYFSGALAAMPSLHIAHAMVMTWFVIQARSALAGIFLLISFWVVIESVASRWHYLIDLPAGALLAVLVIWLTQRFCPLPRRT